MQYNYLNDHFPEEQWWLYRNVVMLKPCKHGQPLNDVVE